ncbi:MAG TPA: prepilin-type N-terminal cleavage/methylation domain-containing protein [Gammaproteobacteria bacterium]|nr:prepilin-type N-terminal cleavage/methylation domain-containing protein [Gammaproteobacteria bacterium]
MYLSWIPFHCIRATSRVSSKLPSRGFTLIEMIAITVVISIVAVALFGVFTNTIRHSADPMLRTQAVAIAQGYLEEALLKAYADPDVAEPTPACEEASRNLYDDVQDYNCVNDNIDGTGPLDQLGNPLNTSLGTGDELGAYNVDVNVSADAIGGVATQRVEVIVTNDNDPSLNITLVGHRANY